MLIKQSKSKVLPLGLNRQKVLGAALSHGTSHGCSHGSTTTASNRTHHMSKIYSTGGSYN